MVNHSFEVSLHSGVHFLILSCIVVTSLLPPPGSYQEVAEFCLFSTKNLRRKTSGVAEFCLFYQFHLTEVFNIRAW